ncbi:S1C family serine protease [Aquibacillus koreensis]|uniref:S1C family serine protease n=1 Tax=Aquibacillus koreensis TaxID=279446 RepID=A0A9X3WQ14_9BACI|nr:S1C family serine protease [Aquibacillus koreensis]MCT2534925.1 S1C family serine protease [Aquibacillus koreensis]MDC3422181.1 S1C family serine protease [Aquibacillus koreensis]
MTSHNDHHNYNRFEDEGKQQEEHTLQDQSEQMNDNIEEQHDLESEQHDQYNSIEQNKTYLASSVSKEQQKRAKEPRSKGLWSMFASGIAGGLVVAVTGATLLSTGIIEQPNTNEPQESIAQETSSTADNNDASTNVIPTAVDPSDGDLSAAISNISDAVVGVSNIQQIDLWSQSQPAGTGSGVIYKKDGEHAFVVTNNHVVEGARDVEVILTNGEHIEAEVLGVDQLTDLAVLRIDSSQVEQVATIGSSGDLTVGETAIAIGTPLGTEFAGSVTKGIISGLERSVEMDLNGDRQPDWTTEVIQTDAAINPGNSGGALINSQGELIGINSMKIAQEAVEGIGFAIPIDSAKPVIDQLETSGSVARPFIGISAISLSEVPDAHKERTLNLDDSVTDGVVVADAQNGSPAAEAGLEQYDVITQINDKEISSMLDLKQYLYAETYIGDEVTITFYRDGQKQTTTLTLTNQDEANQPS